MPVAVEDRDGAFHVELTAVPVGELEVDRSNIVRDRVLWKSGACLSWRQQFPLLVTEPSQASLLLGGELELQLHRVSNSVHIGASTHIRYGNAKIRPADFRGGEAAYPLLGVETEFHIEAYPGGGAFNRQVTGDDEIKSIANREALRYPAYVYRIEGGKLILVPAALEYLTPNHNVPLAIGPTALGYVDVEAPGPDVPEVDLKLSDPDGRIEIVNQKGSVDLSSRSFDPVLPTENPLQNEKTCHRLPRISGGNPVLNDTRRTAIGGVPVGTKGAVRLNLPRDFAIAGYNTDVAAITYRANQSYYDEAQEGVGDLLLHTVEYTGPRGGSQPFFHARPANGSDGISRQSQYSKGRRAVYSLEE